MLTWSIKKLVLVGAVLGIIGGLLLAFGITDVLAKEDKKEKVNICHETGGENNHWVAIQVDDDSVLTGTDYPYTGPVDDKGKPTRDGATWCENNVPEEEEEEPAISINRPTFECGVNYITFGGDYEFPYERRDYFVKFIINGREPEVNWEDNKWSTGELTLAPKDYVIRAELWGVGQENKLVASKDGRFTIDECPVVGTHRWCTLQEDDSYLAEAIPDDKENPEGKPWVTGMDKFCLVPQEPEEPKDEPKIETRTFNEDTRCHDSTPPEPTWVRGVHGSAVNNWHPPFTWSAMGGDTVEFRFSEDPDDLRWSFRTLNDGHQVMGYVEPDNSGILGFVNYYWQMRTINGCKAGPWSDVMRVFN